MKAQLLLISILLAIFSPAESKEICYQDYG